MDWFLYAVALPVALLFLASAGCAIHWARRHGRMHELRLALRTLFGRSSTAGPRHSPLLRVAARPEGASRQT